MILNPEIPTTTRPSKRKIEIMKGEQKNMAWVDKDDVKANCSLFDIFGARLAKYVNDEVRDAQLYLIDRKEVLEGDSTLLI